MRPCPTPSRPTAPVPARPSRPRTDEPLLAGRAGPAAVPGRGASRDASASSRSTGRCPTSWPSCAPTSRTGARAARRPTDRPRPSPASATRRPCSPTGPASPPQSVALGGRSFGGRMCSMAVAEGLPAAALVLIAYPLHPPGRADRLRVEHFPQISVPCLFVSGTRDPFGTPDEFARPHRGHRRAGHPRVDRRRASRSQGPRRRRGGGGAGLAARSVTAPAVRPRRRPACRVAARSSRPCGP